MNNLGNFVSELYLALAHCHSFTDFIESATALACKHLEAHVEVLEGPHEPASSPTVVVLPITAQKKRLGTLVVTRGQPFTPQELTITQTAATAIGLSLYALHNELEGQALKDLSAVRSSLGTLSYSEIEATVEVFRRLSGDEGIIVAAKVASDSKVTRSAIVNALRKLESAGLVESHSMGAKGTFIKIHTKILRDELRKYM